MKRLIITSLISFIWVVSTGQQRPPDNQTTAQLRVLRVNEISNRIMVRKKDPARLQMYALFSDYFTENNIYPNEDAIDLIDAYNKQTTYNEIKTNQKAFRPLLLSPVKIERRTMKVMQRNSMPDRMLKIASDNFNQKQKMVDQLPDSSVPADFKKSLLSFRNIILPNINNNAANIPSLQLDFFLTSLGDINHLMDELTDSTNNENTINGIKEMISDFSAYQVKPVNRLHIRNTRSTSYRPGGNTIFCTIAFTVADEETDSPPDDAELPNADVYVYTRDTLGKWEQQPKPDAFNVYYGANGLKYSLTPGCDTLSFFKYHPSVPASTLPVILAKGNYCFVLQDISNNKLYLRPDINLRDNKVVDDQQLIKLCFKVEN